MGNEDGKCSYNPTNQMRPGAKKEGDEPVGVNEVSTQSQQPPTTAATLKYIKGHSIPEQVMASREVMVTSQNVVSCVVEQGTRVGTAL